MVGIHVVHRRMAEIALIAERRGGFDQISPYLQQELYHCLQVNARLVRRLDELKNKAYIAHMAGDYAWEQDICREIDELEAAII